MQAADRRSWLFPAASGTMHGIDLALLDADDADERRLLIEGEHPELWQIMHEQQPFDHDRYMTALGNLPNSWEAMRPATRPSRAERRRRHGRH